MRFVVAVHGTRGDVEPCLAVGLELMRRGHHVTLAVPPNLLGFAEAAGFGGAVAYGVDSQQQLQTEVFRDWWELRNPVTVLREVRDYVVEGWSDMSDTLNSIAAGADLILTGTTYQELAAVVAEAHHIPLGALHYFPVRPNTRVLPLPLPYAAAERMYALVEWVHWQVLRSAEAAQRRSLGLPPVRTRAVRRMIESGAVEIQAYDEVFFPGLAEQWGDRRPVVGALTLELDTEADDDVASWTAAGEPPVYFGFGSMPVEKPAEAMDKITGACADLGLRALICSGAWDVDGLPTAEHVKVVRSVNHAAVFPMCRAVVHHGGAGTTAAGVRAGVPSLVLWVGAEQPIWGAAIKKLGVGDFRRFATTSRESLRDALASVLSPAYVARARDTAAAMTKPAESITAAADLLEAAAVRGRG
ncbi:glycosyltransferase [Mycolicibacterium sp. S2-37]|uniref:glycosyltransferase n=1 Tax=Mycolicibacterium sp. S2-37 TaxID=2810297 RepID=UPI001A952AEF|nr:glycosyltransferase [Mycolicibacterium sp. S2-37]MBO0676412.1 glycosyltransferase [Mycolicibacterium sp. S2-37]